MSIFSIKLSKDNFTISRDCLVTNWSLCFTVIWLSFFASLTTTTYFYLPQFYFHNDISYSASSQLLWQWLSRFLLQLCFLSQFHSIPFYSLLPQTSCHVRGQILERDAKANWPMYIVHNITSLLNINPPNTLHTLHSKMDGEWDDNDSFEHFPIYICVSSSSSHLHEV